MRTRIFFLLIFQIAALLHTKNAGAQHLQAEIAIDAAAVGVWPPALLGTNFTSTRKTAEETVRNDAFVDSARRVAPTIIRWPGGNNADYYNWKKNELHVPGRRRNTDDMLNLDDILIFSRKIGAELSITINFGTMHARDAADMVEFCNGSSASFWGAKRDSILLAHGYAAGPLNVRYFEIGNETYARHMFDNSWTAMNPAKYFLGGDAERRGALAVVMNGQRVNYPLGDLFEIRSGDADAVYDLRFPPVRKVVVRLFADRAAVENCMINGECTFETFRQVDSLNGQGADAKVFVLDSLAGSITFGDGAQGFRPPVGSFILAEYTTVGHDGFVAMARAMRRVPSGVPIKIGATMLPAHPTLPESTYVPEDSLQAVFEQMDFLILHHYLPTNSARTQTYNRRRQAALERVRNQDDMFRLFRDASREALGYEKEIGLAITEWNVFNKSDSLVRRNRALETAVIGAEWLIRSVNRLSQTPVWFAEQFDLAAWDSKFALIELETISRSIAPLGYLFSALRPWRSMTQRLPVSVQSPEALAYDASIPFIRAAAVRSTDGDTLLAMVSNNAEHDSIACTITLQGFAVKRATVRFLTGATPRADNDGGEPARLTEPVALTSNTIIVPPHSIAFLSSYADETTAVVSDDPFAPRRASLAQNYPNPFNPRTTIRFFLPERQYAVLKVYDVLGKHIATPVEGELAPGEHRIVFDAVALGSGVYFYSLSTARFTQMKKMLLMR